MKKYIPSFKISNRMLQLVASISEKVGKISCHDSLEVRPHLRRNNRIKSIHSSLKIEASSLSFTEVRAVVNGIQVIGNKKEIQEVKNAYLAYEKISDANPYSVEDIKLLHGIMMEGIISDSGSFRRGQEGVFWGNQCIFVAPPPHMVPVLMSELFTWMDVNRDKIHPLILSSVFHYEFVFIHPFSDGNGRMARLWHTALLSDWRDVFEFIPLESQIEAFQEDYYQAISECHVNGTSDVFIEFILEQIDNILDEINIQTERVTEETSEYVRKMLFAMEFDIPYTSAAIMEKLGLKSKETFRKNYMNPALEAGYVIMTVPDKPRSKNQRYIRKK